MIRSDSRLYLYQCGNCLTSAVSIVKAVFGNPLRCNLCYRGMKFQWVIPIETDEQRAWAVKGTVYNPGVSPAPRVPCDNVPCRHAVGRVYGHWIEGVGNFCSLKCAAAGVARHEAAMNTHKLASASGE